ncbi:MAG: histidine phosphatase family protein [Candidatus Nanopelagicaceae bacterium]
MTRIYLLRHAESKANQEGILAGRMSDMALSNRGKKQSQRIANSLQSMNFTKIYISPLQRCRETINPFLSLSGRRAYVNDDFIEMDYGDWSGRKLEELRREPLWKQIQSKPSEVRFPKGESFKQAEGRIRRGLNTLARNHPNGQILVVSHGDPIKIALQIALDGSIDNFQRFLIDPGSLTLIDWGRGSVLDVNLPISKMQKFSDSSENKNLRKRRVLGGGTDGAPRI